MSTQVQKNYSSREGVSHVSYCRQSGGRGLDYGMWMCHKCHCLEVIWTKIKSACTGTSNRLHMVEPWGMLPWKWWYECWAVCPGTGSFIRVNSQHCRGEAAVLKTLHPSGCSRLVLWKWALYILMLHFTTAVNPVDVVADLVGAWGSNNDYVSLAGMQIGFKNVQVSPFCQLQCLEWLTEV